MAKSDQPGSKRAGRKKGSKTKRTTAGTARRTGNFAAPSRRKAVPPDPTLAQVLEQQKAASEILQAIASAPGDLDSVLQAVALNAARLCEADDAQIYRLQENKLQLAASQGLASAPKEASLDRGWVTGRSIIDRQTIHVPDLAAESEEEYPIAKAMQREHGHYTTLATPLLTASSALGAILIRRWDVNPFTDAQIGLLETFASQAVVAIENARIVSELETRNKELDDALEQQNAMAELLRAISSANGELKPVFETLLRNAIRLCEAEFGLLFLKEGDEFTAIAMLGLTEAFRKHMEGRRYRFGRGTATGRAVLAGKPVQIVDLKAETGSEDAEARNSTVELGGGRTIFSVPMMQDSRAIGAITIYRREVRPFAEKQIELVSSFANHAVIAVENARLLNDLQDSLRQQTATADVLKTISSTAFDLDAVLSTLLQSALELCGAFAGSFLVREGDAFVDVIQIGWPEEFSEFVRGRSSRPGTGSVGQRVALTGEIVHAHDVLNDPDYEYKDAQKLGGYRTVLGAPLIRDGEVIGILMLARDEVRPFADNEIRLVQTFCDQAVIAFQNSRLLQELQDRNDDLSEALDQQTATAEILRAISTSPTDTQPVFDAIARHAARLCRGQYCNVFRFDGELLHFVAHHGSDQKKKDIIAQAFPDRPGMGTAAQRTILKRAVVQIPAIASDPDYRRIDVS
ncbi:MAG TPA: GAF domain-containing protein, partial [Afifellaceae bacterium]|nr:GAF domain-containing protein [Afifellaceae bacterium]